jgi:hypothetical protein
MNTDKKKKPSAVSVAAVADAKDVDPVAMVVETDPPVADA